MRSTTADRLNDDRPVRPSPRHTQVTRPVCLSVCLYSEWDARYSEEVLENRDTMNNQTLEQEPGERSLANRGQGQSCSTDCESNFFAPIHQKLDAMIVDAGTSVRCDGLLHE